MFPIAQINTHSLMQRALLGSRISDPVVPERPKRRRRPRPEARQPAPACAPLALKPRGTS